MRIAKCAVLYITNKLMTLQNTQKMANHIMRLLKVNDVILPIARTSKGNFGIRFSNSNEDYEMYLDAVPLTTNDFLKDENNIELKRMLDKYLFDVSGLTTIAAIRETYDAVKPQHDAIVAQDKPRRGRPVGSKNGKKNNKEG